MAIISEKTKCDLGGEIFEQRENCRNDASILNGENTRVYVDVCDKCAGKLADKIDEAFPKNKYAKLKVE